MQLGRNRYLRPSALALLVLGLRFPSCTYAATLLLDPIETHIDFTLSDVLHTVHGTFKLKRGAVQFDEAAGKASGALIVDTTSGDSGSSARDRRMHKDILESAKYPEIIFTPLRIQGNLAPKGKSQVGLEGLIKLHGAEHPFTIPMMVEVSGERLTADAHFIIPYVSWGLKNPSTFILRVSDKVELQIRAVGRLSSSSPEF